MLYDFSPASHALLECSAIEGQTQTHVQAPVSLAHSELCGSFLWNTYPVNLWNCTATGTGQALGPLSTGNIGITDLKMSFHDF